VYKWQKRYTAPMKNHIIALIPARYASSRFPAKMLATIQGKSLLQRTYESTKRCTALDDVLIVTDDARIFDHATSFGAKCLMTSPDCPTGSDRLIEALNLYPELTKGDIIVNVQGDEPCIHVETIEKVAAGLQKDLQAVMSTAAVAITDFEEITNPSVVKVVCDSQGSALYFSRSPIPGIKPKSKVKPCYYKHLGIYAYRRDFLLTYGKLPQTPLQLVEDLEQLRVLESGYKIKVEYVTHTSPHVDVPEDITKVEQWLCKQNISS
jgi:3-deoxy-manno-octulosonate cytidylyltransferase (CMP-KDO synthetase)